MKPNKWRSGEVAKWPKSRLLPHFATPPLRHSGQALIEFAIMGSIALLAFTVLIQMGLRMNYQQEIQQDAFRNALRIAQNEG